jgi:hypothetical protein
MATQRLQPHFAAFINDVWWAMRMAGSISKIPDQGLTQHWPDSQGEVLQAMLGRQGQAALGLWGLGQLTPEATLP